MCLIISEMANHFAKNVVLSVKTPVFVKAGQNKESPPRAAEYFKECNFCSFGAHLLGPKAECGVAGNGVIPAA